MQWPKGVKRITLDIYNGIVIHVTTDWDKFTQIRDYLGLPELKAGSIGHTTHACSTKGVNVILAYLKLPASVNTIAHEALHATLFVCDIVGLERSDDEALCYLLGYITEKMHEVVDIA